MSRLFYILSVCDGSHVVEGRDFYLRIKKYLVILLFVAKTSWVVASLNSDEEQNMTILLFMVIMFFGLSLFGWSRHLTDAGEV